MDYFWKTITILIVGVILWVVVEKQERHLSVLLSTALCCITVYVAATYLKPVISFVKSINQVDNAQVRTLLQCAGVASASEITARLCNDAGNTSAGSMARFLGSSAMLYCSIPIFQTLMDLIGEMIGVI